MSLKQKPVSLPEDRPAGGGRATAPGTPVPEKGSRRLGLLLVVVGVVLLALAAGDALAGTEPGGVRSDTPRGSEAGERLGGQAGNDELYGFGGDDLLAGGEGDDELYGGPGRDLLLGGEGDDFIEARDGVVEYVDCGPGKDTAGVDAGDRLAPGCETVFPG